MLAALVMALQASAAQDAASHGPDDRLTSAASLAIVQCIMMREAKPGRTAFIAGVGPLRQRLAADPRLAGVAVDDAGGRGCRVSFIGSTTDADLMAARARMTPNQLLFTREPRPDGREVVSTTLIDPRP